MSPRISHQPRPLQTPHAAPPVRSEPAPARTPPRAEASRLADSFEAGGTSRAKQDRELRGAPEVTPTAPSRLERSAAFERLPAESRERVRGLELGASPAAVRNLASIVSGRGFSELAPERQREMLDCFSRHPEDRRVTSALTHLASSRAFREADAAAQSAAIREAPIPVRLRSDALRVLNTTEPTHLSVNGAPIDVYGASPGELETIRSTLARLPASHLRTIPCVVVGDTIGHGNNASGGAWVPARTIAAYERGGGGGRNAAAYHAEGWRNPPRLELTHESLGRPAVMRDHLSPTILHETGHAVDERYELSGALTPESLGRIDYNGRGYTAPGVLGPVNERFADGYMSHYMAGLGSDPVARRTISSAIDRVPTE